jgi:HJR/Mrr/RecB family endonuclease
MDRLSSRVRALLKRLYEGVLMPNPGLPAEPAPPGYLHIPDVRARLAAVQALRSRSETLREVALAALACAEESALLDPKSHRRRASLTALGTAVTDVLETFDEGLLVWDELNLIEETMEFASHPILQTGDGLYGPTRKLLDRYAEHSESLLTLCQDVADHALDFRTALVELSESGCFRPVANMAMEEVDRMHHSAFEQFIADLLDRDGYRIVRSGDGAGDQGADVLAKDDLGRHLMVQCKHFRDGNGSVGQPVVQHLYGGAVTLHPSTLPVIVTNRRMTGGPHVWCEEDNRVRMIDRDRLEQWAEDGTAFSDVLAKPSGP